MQLLIVGIPQLTPTGAIIRDDGGQELKVYTEDDVKELARIFTGWAAQINIQRSVTCMPSVISRVGQSFFAGSVGVAVIVNPVARMSAVYR